VQSLEVLQREMPQSDSRSLSKDGTRVESGLALHTLVERSLGKEKMEVQIDKSDAVTSEIFVFRIRLD
jgi:hypothetical protein